MQFPFTFFFLYLTAAGLVCVAGPMSAQALKGRVLEQKETGPVPLIGANVVWQGTAAGTSTDAEGRFSLPTPPSPASAIIVSYIGYLPDTVSVTGQTEVQVFLSPSSTLGEVTVVGQENTFSAITPTHAQVITSRDLEKSACCNLAESFETNASVEVTMADAVSGAKQIQMLGLDGSYTLMTTDNVPALRGLATPFRLNYLSGTFIDAIDIIKGTGSVLNGYESVSGQVNIRLKDPEKSERVYLNLYGNDLAKFDANLNVSATLNPKLNTILMLHTDHLGNRADRNGDGFMDLPLSTQYNLFNKWKYQTGKNIVSEIGIGALREKRVGGQTGYTEGTALHSAFYGTESETDRVTGYTKSSYTFADKPYQSVGLILSGTGHDFRSVYGRRTYDGWQRTGQANLIFQSVIGNTAHTYKTGLSYLVDHYQENLQDTTLARAESVPGAFFEYVYQNFTNLTVVGGLRADYHNLFGPVFTPRFNLKYDLNPNTILRMAAGKGFRVANPVAENVASLVSNRYLVFSEQLQPERAWNMGGSLTKYFEVDGRPGAFVADYYYTTFQNQVVVDMYSSPHELRFTNLQGRSFSKSFQAELQYEALKGLNLKTAYKYYDVRTTYSGQLLQRPFMPNHRFFFNAGYATAFDKWKFDFTTQLYGSRLVPLMNHTPGRPEIGTESARAYTTLHAQVTRAFKRWDLYVGGENLTNFRQQNPIIGADDPFSSGFDAAMMWGPVLGRVVYAGLRFKID
jgi:outer membrane receptor for ferrienterochelin and colicins